ncbi:uncharacterized protein LOC115307909 isoform X3 [Manacus vitellinus]|uniref:uncharacterized protein LOC115307909 isoform X3 n=1 Tax=Manacus vitellinus TaxID=328815 RepID=UPI00115CBB4A|nr:uncharacterized protein LOC115307909 isoform X3 [Manacus vitellinus]
MAIGESRFNASVLVENKWNSAEVDKPKSRAVRCAGGSSGHFPSPQVSVAPWLQLCQGAEGTQTSCPRWIKLLNVGENDPELFLHVHSLEHSHWKRPVDEVGSRSAGAKGQREAAAPPRRRRGGGEILLPEGCYLWSQISLQGTKEEKHKMDLKVGKN